MISVEPPPISSSINFEELIFSLFKAYLTASKVSLASSLPSIILNLAPVLVSKFF